MKINVHSQNEGFVLTFQKIIFWRDFDLFLNEKISFIKTENHKVKECAKRCQKIRSVKKIWRVQYTIVLFWAFRNSSVMLLSR